MVAGLQVLPLNLGRDMGLPAVALLQLLEASTGVGFCHYCCSLGPWCKCVGPSQPVPPASWSQIVEQTPGYGVTTSSGGMTTPSTSAAEMPGYMVPLPGLTPPDFSSWSLPPTEAPPPQGLPTASQGLPGIGRSIQIRATTERHTRAQLVQGPMGSDAAHVSAAHSSDGTASPSATTWLASNSVPTGGTAARQVYREGSHF